MCLPILHLLPFFYLVIPFVKHDRNWNKIEIYLCKISNNNNNNVVRNITLILYINLYLIPLKQYILRT